MGNDQVEAVVDPSEFLDNDCVQSCLIRLKEHWDRHKPVISNIRDREDNQYVDLVMQGGGTLGIALVGYTYALESVGIRFKSIGGTSAGAINAILLASIAPPPEKKAELILKILARLQMAKFLDGPDRHRKLVIDGSRGKIKLKLLPLLGRAIPLFQTYKRVRYDLGMHPGDYFRQWLDDELEKVQIATRASLRERMNQFPPDLLYEQGATPPEHGLKGKLRVVAADITTMTKVVFPEMADLYYADEESVPPAEFVRASMSIPLVFHPFTLHEVPTGDEADSLWRERTSFPGTVPSIIRFVDGGILSNFPISLFHRDDKRPPLCPTLGVRLGPNRSYHAVRTLLQLAKQSFNTSRSGADYDFLARHQEYRRLVQRIDTQDVSWLDFEMPLSEKKRLFRYGVVAATHFLINRFDWHHYQILRAELDEQEPLQSWIERCDPKKSDDPGPDHPTEDQLTAMLGKTVATECLL